MCGAGKWSGGVLAPNGRIYGIPALAKSVLEIDIEQQQANMYGMLPGGNELDDKFSGGVLAPNGKIYGTPWRSSQVLEFDPTTKATPTRPLTQSALPHRAPPLGAPADSVLRVGAAQAINLLGSFASTNFSWGARPHTAHCPHRAPPRGYPAVHC